MKRFFQIFAIAALALGFTACDEQSETPNNEEINISLTADKREILADGIDTVTFTALVNGKSNSDIQLVCTNNNSFLKGNTFTTTEAGEYEFAAIYGNKSSERIKVTATAIAVPTFQLIGDKQSIVADGADCVTFTVMYEDVDVTSLSTITEVNSNLEIDGNTFYTIAAGDYSFIAEFDGCTSAPFNVTATPYESMQKTLKLTASKIRIKADGADKVVFTAMYGEEDVTASCTIKASGNIVAENGEFTTTTPGTYNFFAYYEELTQSNLVSIDAYDPAITGQYEIGSICEINGTKGVVYAIKNNKVYVVSLDEAFLQWSTENVWCNCMSENGSFNTSDPFDPTYCRADGGVRDINNYPAFKWCKEHGADWYLPSSTELQWLWDVTSGGKHEYNCDEMKAFNKILTDNGGTAIGEDYYWSSNETSAELIEFVAFMHNSVICADPQKTSKMLTRAITCFNISVD